MGKIIRVLIFSDGHGNLKNLDAINDKITTSDLILFGGDFTQFNEPKTGKPYLEKILDFKKPVFSVLGNCDYPDMLDFTKKAEISIDGFVKKYGDFYLTGSGGGSKFTGTTPYERTDAELVSDLDEAQQKLNTKKISSNNLIVITHNPPYKTNLDKVPNAHVGSKLIRKFIEKYQPLLHISGHIHESFGVDQIGKTILVNPGALAEGRYATCNINIEKTKFEVQNLELKQLC